MELIVGRPEHSRDVSSTRLPNERALLPNERALLPDERFLLPNERFGG
ncbi:hypothetical protein GCM10009773_36000 [Williamsia serinedens]